LVRRTALGLFVRGIFSAPRIEAIEQIIGHSLEGSNLAGRVCLRLDAVVAILSCLRVLVVHVISELDIDILSLVDITIRINPGGLLNLIFIPL
jgi:hypothetical protein